VALRVLLLEVEVEGAVLGVSVEVEGEVEVDRLVVLMEVVAAVVQEQLF
jgi:hypothetical protein